MKATLLTSFLTVLTLVSSAPSPSPYEISHTTSLHCRDKPSTSTGKIVHTYTSSSNIQITCQTIGDTINGNSIWDKTKDGCYVSDYYVKTGVNGFISGTPRCPGTPSSSSIPGPRVDDYRYKSACGGIDAWRYYTCYCTSFVAQRINERLGVRFNNMYRGVNWGAANTWGRAARETGVTINGTPKPGCVAQTNAGKLGHVAWVSAVEGNYVVIEEYNYVHPFAYSVRTVPKGQFNYIHLTGST